MPRKSSLKTPTVISKVLYTNDQETTGTSIDTLQWFSWLESVGRSFYFEAGDHGFTVIRESIPGRAGFFWYAIKKIEGRRRRIYLGRSSALTLEKLSTTAAKFAQMGESHD